MKLSPRLSACLFLPSLLVTGLWSGCSSTEDAPSCTTPRDPALWPFESNDPWNTSLGSDATFAAPASPVFDPLKGGSLNCKAWSHPVFIAQPTDPFRSIRRSDGSVCAEVRVPADAAPDPEADAHLHLIGDSHSSVVETWSCSRQGDDYVAESCVVNDLRGPGVYEIWHGVRAYGGSALGGLIRRGELQNGIPHALAVSINPASLNKTTPNGKGFVWPASATDRGYETSYGSSGNLYMGTLLAIPPSVSLSALGLSAGGAALGRAMQDYGAYITDIADANMAFYAEPAAADEITGDLAKELNKLTALLEVVTNNTPASRGGGGSPRRCPAPPFIP